MTRRARGLAAAGCLALVALVPSLAGCSGEGDDSASSDPSSDASSEEFCAAFNGLFDEVMAEASAGDSAAMLRALKEWAADIEAVGAPEDMPEDARAGFELFVEQAKGLDEDATLADLERLGEDLSESDRADGEAFGEWARENCPLDLPRRE